MKNKVLFIVLALVLLLASCQSDTDSTGLKVAVSIGPQKAFVEAIAGDLVEVVVMIPPGFSPANYQPTPKQMVDFNDASVYFHLDVPAEVNIMSSISNDNIRLVDLADVSDSVYPARYFEEEEEEEEDHDEEHDHDHVGRDPHIWLSPRRVVVMMDEMIKVLSEIDPENKDVYESNGKAYIEKLTALDEAWMNTFSEFDDPTFLIYHPSYGYFSDDYNLNMMPIESEGKTATIKGLEDVIDYAIAHDIKGIFYQDEFDSQQAEIVAKEIGGKTIKVSPLSENYIEALEEMVEALKDILD